MDGNPYRVPWQSPAPAAKAEARGLEELAIPMVVLFIGALRAVPALLRHEDFGAGATVALIMVVLGLSGIAFDLARRLSERR